MRLGAPPVKLGAPPVKLGNTPKDDKAKLIV